jgi:hypothetical protein
MESRSATLSAVNTAALVVSVLSVLIALGALLYARKLDQKVAQAVAAAQRSAAAAERSAEAGESARALEQHRRNAELRPRFRLRCGPTNPGVETRRLTVFLAGPPELERLETLIVSVRDDHPWRGEGTPLAGGPTPEQVAEQIWEPYRFTAGPGLVPVRLTGLRARTRQAAQQPLPSRHARGRGIDVLSGAHASAAMVSAVYRPLATRARTCRTAPA